MREIKFRAWTGTRMFDVDVLAIGKVMWDSGGTGVSLPYQPSRRVMQYTGLKDKNGVEIYEGDILSAFYGTQLTSVKWNSEFGLYEVTLQLSGDSETADELLGNHLSVVEVIGNIYENPELLNQT